MDRNLKVICGVFVLIGLVFFFILMRAYNVNFPFWIFFTIFIGLFFFLWGYTKGWHKREWRKNIIGVVVIISIIGLGVILFATTIYVGYPNPFTGLFIVLGFVLIAVGIVVRKFWPHRQGSIGIWFFSFSTSEWLSLIVYGIFLLALGMFLAWVFAPLT